MFFNPNNEDDLNLINSKVRDHPELASVASQVEWEVIDAYRQRDQGRTNWNAFFELERGGDPSRGLKVRLIGYDPDNPEKSDEGLKEALRRTIADIISKTLIDYDRTGAISEQQGNRSITYARASSWREWPSGWRYRLTNYDARTATYGI